MKFVFCDKSKVEMNIITDFLYDEKIPYKIRPYIVKDFFFSDEDEDNDDEDFCIIEEMYNIECFTDLEHFEFVKNITNKKIKERMELEKFYLLEPYIKGKKYVRKKRKNNIKKR